jgi:NDP-sugar pyrophosphorylase family protein
MASSVQAVLMAGGKGTRLRPYTAVIPKPLVPIGESSILERLIGQLRAQGFERVKVSVGHKAEIIMAVIGDGERFGIDVSYHREEKPRGTLGALASMTDLDDNFLVMNGDLCTNLRFKDLLEDHVASEAVATVGTYHRVEKIDLGVIDLEPGTNTVVGFREKPVFNFFVSMGVNAFHRSVLDLIPRDEYFGFDDLMLKMLAGGHKIRSYRYDGLWRDIGRPDDYDRMCQEYEEGTGLFERSKEQA